MRPIGRQESFHRDTDDMADTVLPRRFAKIEKHRLEQSRLTRINELRGRNRAIVNREHAGLDPVFETSSVANSKGREDRCAAGCLPRAGPEAGDDVVSFRHKEVPVGRTRDALTGGPASPAQHFARVEPRLRVIFVWIRAESRKRQKI